MKFLIDAQLPYLLVQVLKDHKLDTIHTLDLPDKNLTSDNQILDYAKSDNRIIITKDADFLQSFMIAGEPEKLILLRTGNISNRALLDLFRKNLEQILKLIASCNLIEITKEEIIAHD